MKKHKPFPQKNKSPSFDEIIKHHNYGRKLQSEAIFSSFLFLRKWLKSTLGRK